MIDIKNIFPECDVDTLLVELITRRGNANHNKGCSKVSKALESNYNKQGPIIGVIDSDKFKRIDQDPYLPRFSQVVCNKVKSEESLKLNKLPNKAHYLVYIHPEFEPWLWKQAQLAEINIDSFYTSYDDFERDSKKWGLDRSPKLKSFVNKVVSSNPPGIAMLRKWIVDNDFEC